jgi:ribulose-5-phosphate 4-epimerase/fuculose-1-phosphate aldolase
VSELEGTIQFAYELTPCSTPLLDAPTFAELSAWRSILFDLELLGQDKDRYLGFAYGNLSVRSDDSDEFIISASQTSGVTSLKSEHLVRITHCNLDRFWVDAQGQEPPSSESLTHAMIYSADPRMRCVFHVHSPTLWRNRAALALPETAMDVSYGSPAMVSAVSDLMDKHQSRPLTFATAGHEDGIFTCGHTLRDCGGLLISYLAKARAQEHKEHMAHLPERPAGPEEDKDNEEEATS